MSRDSRRSGSCCSRCLGRQGSGPRPAPAHTFWAVRFGVLGFGMGFIEFGVYGLGSGVRFIEFGV